MGMTVKGIDVSHHNKDWMGKANITYDDIPFINDVEFAYIKASEGATFKDPAFQWNLKSLRKVGIKNLGAYHFFRQNASAQSQFQNFKKQVGKERLSLPPVIDFEFAHAKDQQELKQMQNTLLELCNLMEKQYGKQPVIYCVIGDYRRFLKNHKQLRNYPIWLENKGKNIVPEEIPNVVISQYMIYKTGNYEQLRSYPIWFDNKEDTPTDMPNLVISQQKIDKTPIIEIDVNYTTHKFAYNE